MPALKNVSISLTVIPDPVSKNASDVPDLAACEPRRRRHRQRRRRRRQGNDPARKAAAIAPSGWLRPDPHIPPGAHRACLLRCQSGFEDHAARNTGDLRELLARANIAPGDQAFHRMHDAGDRRADFHERQPAVRLGHPRENTGVFVLEFGEFSLQRFHALPRHELLLLQNLECLRLPADHVEPQLRSLCFGFQRAYPRVDIAGIESRQQFASRHGLSDHCVNVCDTAAHVLHRIRPVFGRLPLDDHVAVGNNELIGRNPAQAANCANAGYCGQKRPTEPRPA
jgi:hypothetical protein